MPSPIAPRYCLGLFLLGTFAAAGPAQGLADPERGQRLLDAYFRSQTRRIADGCLADLKSKEDWERKRPERRRQLLEMLGLWPLPPRTDLHPVITGKVEAEAFTVEKLHFQSRPGLYVSANLYLPKKAASPAPAVLYLCGHGGTIINGVSYGNHVYYQHHPAWFAEHGFVCLIIDSLELGEIRGEHHGTYKENRWWWQTLGYTPAGVECWNAMRAIDYLQSRKEIDPKRIGVTGRSGGGAYSWWVTAADERVQCAVPVAGIADLQAHLVEGEAPRLHKGVIAGHCDCMYMVNTYRWDFADVAALCAPRPVLLGNSDHDDIFPVAGYRRLADKVRKVYELYGAGDRFALLETAGPHKDTPELRLGAYRWLCKRLKKDDPGEITERLSPRFTPEQLKVFARPPEDAVNSFIDETFIRPARPERPLSPAVVKEWWPAKRLEWLQALNDKVFHGWPDRPPALGVRPAGDVTDDGVRVRGYDFTSEEGVELRLWLTTAAKVEKPSLVVLTAVGEEGWRDWLRELGPAFKDVLQVKGDFTRDDERFKQDRRLLERFGWGFATLAPRGVGPTRWAEPGSPEDHHIKRRFPLVGQTLDGQRVWDVRRALAVLRGLPEVGKTTLWLQGKHSAAGIVLYAALFEPDVARLDLYDLPASHVQGPTLLNVRRTLDVPQALALAFPRRIFLYTRGQAEAARWEWPLGLQRALGQEYLKFRPLGN
jgi:dienelactone hydrolase